MRASGPSTAPHGQRRCMQTTPAAGLSVEHMPAVLRRHCHSSPEAAPPRIRSLFAARASTTVERQTQAPQHTVGASTCCACRSSDAQSSEVKGMQRACRCSLIGVFARRRSLGLLPVILHVSFIGTRCSASKLQPLKPLYVGLSRTATQADSADPVSQLPDPADVLPSPRAPGLAPDLRSFCEEHRIRAYEVGASCHSHCCFQSRCCAFTYILQHD